MSTIKYKGNTYSGAANVTDADHLTCEDGSGNTITAQSAIQNILGDFATIESSTAASKAYAVGDYLILNGNFYKVTTAISQGDTITVGTNVIRTNVGDEFKSFEFPVRELTKAQYTALPSSQQNDGTIYLITDDDGGWEAENSTYDNTSSGLTATNVQDALDEISSNIDDLVADDIGYDNTESGLTATNVQDAVDEINSNFSGISFLQAIRGLTGSTETSVTLPLNHIIFNPNTPMLLYGVYRSAGDTNNDGIAIIKKYSDVAYIAKKQGFATLTAVSYSVSDNTITFTCGSYMSLVLIAVNDSFL